MLGEHFFPAESVNTRTDGTLVVRIRPGNGEEAAALRALTPDKYRGRKQVAFAYQDDATDAHVEAVDSESAHGHTSFTLALSPEPKGNSFMTEVTFNSISPDEIAEIRAHLLLLGKPPSDVSRKDVADLRSMFGLDAVTDKGAFLTNLWEKLKLPAGEYLPRARLALVYRLKTSNTVEHVFDLKLGPIHEGAMQIYLRGQRAVKYENVPPVVMTVSGDYHF